MKYALLLGIALATCAVTRAQSEELEADLLIVGGTESGWAAAIQAARNGVESILIVHDGEWLGGQFTEQALACVDENKGVGKVGWGVDWHPMKRSFHRSGLFSELMERIEAFNTEKYGSPMPGLPYHGPSTFRPAEAEAIFREMLKPYVDSGQVRWITNRYPVRAELSENRLEGLWFAPVDGGEADLHVRARMTIDASDWGEAIQVSGAAFEYGPDPASRYGEASAPVDLSENPINEMNPITWAMIVEESDGETPIPRPARFDDRNYPRATHLSRAEFGKLKWDRPAPMGSIAHWPDAGKASARQLSVYSVRRVVDGFTSKTGKTAILLNYMNGQDYPLERLPQPVVDALEATEPGASEKNIVVMTRRQRQVVFEDAKQHALGVLYHLQNFVHDRAEDKVNSFRRFHLSREFGTADHLPPKPYIRESLRLKAMYMMREQDGRNRDGETKTRAKERFAHVMYPDGLFAWQFHYDFHRTGRTYLNGEGASGPWIDYHKPRRHTKFLSDRSVFPLRSLIPEKVDGLLGAQKNVGYSSIVSAAIRLHDQCIAVGQAAGATAAVALRHDADPREFPYDRARLEEIRHALCGEVDGAVPLLIWPFRDLAPESGPAFVAVNRLAALGVLQVGEREVDFRPNDAAGEEWVADLESRSGVRGLEAADGSRADYCVSLWRELSKAGFDRFAFKREKVNDADGDGIADSDDALLFTPNDPIIFAISAHPKGDDGVPGAEVKSSGKARWVNFCGPGVGAVEGFVSDHGKPFQAERGFGWGRDLGKNHRRRDAMDGAYRDTFIFTRERDVWEYAVENGRYRVTICVGDSGHEQLLQKVSLEGQLVVNEVSTNAGEFAERTAEVVIEDGRLTVEIGSGKPQSNTCVNWIGIEPL